eukprot:TRINITY_DN24797_c0_g1_i2.p1 TRINITY_DN24797_c0_g1~~TRINITY_DN24797_c0_g1_i2.p1  ORF type:complete len:1441 (+),score=190.52 TRINITY_DN24797_c0_g1_i2:160-4482(+)
MGKLKESMLQLKADGPANISGLAAAKRILHKYAMQARHMKSAIASGNSQLIEEKLQSWNFNGDDDAVIGARSTLNARERMKIDLRSAVEAMDGLMLQDAVSRWRFEAEDQDYVEARTALENHNIASGELRRLMDAFDLAGVCEVVSNWSFAQSDPLLQAARVRVESHENAVRTAVDRADGWQLQRLWTHGGHGRSLIAAAGDLRELSCSFLRRYNTDVETLRSALQRESFGANLAGLGPSVQSCVDAWSYGRNDPTLLAAQMWLRERSAVLGRSRCALKSALEGGNIYAARSALSRVKRLVPDDCPEVSAVESLMAAHTSALEGLGMIALGLPLKDLEDASHRCTTMDRAVDGVLQQVQALSDVDLADLRSQSKPDALVHGTLEVCMNLLAGIHPYVRNPPRDTHWRSIQQVLANSSEFCSLLVRVPAWIAAGNGSGVARARDSFSRLAKEFGSSWSAHHVGTICKVAGHIFMFNLTIFDCVDALIGTVPMTTFSPSPRPRQSTSASVPVPPMAPKTPSIPWCNSNVIADSQARLRAVRTLIPSNDVLVAAWLVLDGNPEDPRLSSHVSRRNLASARAVSILADVVESCKAIRPPSSTIAETCVNPSACQQRSAPPSYLTDGQTQSDCSALARPKTSHGARFRAETASSSESVSACDSPANLAARPATSCGGKAKSKTPSCSSSVGPPSSRGLSGSSSPGVDKSLDGRGKARPRSQKVERPAKTKRCSVDSALPCVPGTLPAMLKEAIAAVVALSPSALDALDTSGRSVAEPAVLLLRGAPQADPQVAARASSEPPSPLPHSPAKFGTHSNGQQCSEEVEVAALVASTSKVTTAASKLNTPRSIAAPGSSAATPPARAACTPSKPATPATSLGGTAKTLWRRSQAKKHKSVHALMLEVLRAASDVLGKAEREPRHCYGGSAMSSADEVVSSPQSIQPTQWLSGDCSIDCSERASRSQAMEQSKIRDVSPLSHFRGAAAAMMVLGCDSEEAALAFDSSTSMAVSSSLFEPVFAFEPLHLSAAVIESMHVPLINIFCASQAMERSCIDTASCVGYEPAALAVERFVHAMTLFYSDFVLQRPARAEAAVACAEAEQTSLRNEASASASVGIVALASELLQCGDLPDVMAISKQVAEQLESLAKRGVALPALHVERVRQAIDKAGESLLLSRPAADPICRLRWVERAVALQLSPMAHFDATLSSIAANHLCPEQLRQVGEQRSPSPETRRLIAAVLWIVEASCTCDCSWEECQVLLRNPEALIGKLAVWSLVRSATLTGLRRALDLLAEIWFWAASGCGGSQALGALYAWASLAAVLLPMVEVSQRLVVVKKTVTTALAKVSNITAVPAKDATAVKVRAWTTVLFQLDDGEEPWWWLSLIRAGANLPRPWTDADEGGVGHEPEEDDATGRQLFLGVEGAASAQNAVDCELDGVSVVGEGSAGSA